MAETPYRHDGNPKHATIHKLPGEIMLHIFKLVRHVDISFDLTPFDGIYRNDEGLAAIQNARLVCRAWCLHASPHLVPVLRVWVTNDSLDRMEHLVGNPEIARGIRLIQLSLSYYSKLIVDNFDRWQVDLDQVLLKRVHEDYERNKDSTEPENEKTRKAKALEVLIDKIQGLNSMHDYSVRQCRASHTASMSQDHENLFCQADGIYKLRYEQQIAILSDGSFLRRFTAAACQAKGLRALFLGDQRPWQGLTAEEILHSPDRTVEFLATPEPWRFPLRDRRGGTDTRTTAGLLWEIPVAMSEAGSPLHGLGLSRALVHHGTNAVHEHAKTLDAGDWDRLKAASQELTLFHFGVRSNHRSSHYISNLVQSAFDPFLNAFLSAPRLSVVSLDLKIISNFQARDSSRFYMIHDALRLHDPSRLQRLHLTNFHCEQGQLESMIRGLGSALRELRITDVYMSLDNQVQLVDLDYDGLSSQ